MSETTPSQPPPLATPTLPSQTNTERVAQNGLVGLFDILGYQAFLDKNCPETATEEVQRVLNTLLSLDVAMLQKLRTLLERFGEVDVSEIVKRFKWLVFSDTVLLTLDLSELSASTEESLSDHEIKEGYWYFFLMLCSMLWKSMFEFGLPLRGAITKGPYLVQKACFAGKPIVEAHKLASDVNCAGVVIAASVIEWCKAEMPGSIASGVFHFDYSFPSKTKGFVENAALNVSYALQENQERWAGDIRQLVHESFFAHNKGIDPGVPKKIENTERLLRFLKMKWPDGFSDPSRGKT